MLHLCRKTKGFHIPSSSSSNYSFEILHKKCLGELILIAIETGYVATFFFLPEVYWDLQLYINILNINKSGGVTYTSFEII